MLLICQTVIMVLLMETKQRALQQQRTTEQRVEQHQTYDMKLERNFINEILKFKVMIDDNQIK